MGYEFRCRDPGAACDAAFEAPTEDELMAEVERHLEDDHKIANVTETLTSYVRTLISSH